MKLKGIDASEGYAIAKVYKLENTILAASDKKVTAFAEEKISFQKAHDKSKTEIMTIRDNTVETLGEEHAAIFDAHIQIMEDPELLGEIYSMMETERVSASYAWEFVSDQYINVFESMDNDYMRERAADLKDIQKRMMCHLLNVKVNDLTSIKEPVILVADDITPSETAQLNKHYIMGFATNIGGRTSHSAIMAKTLEIPAVVGLTNILEHVKHGDVLILDGVNGEVIINPDLEVIERYKIISSNFEIQKSELKKYLNNSSVTRDGHIVELVANIGTVDDIESVLKSGAEGIGLFRTEFLYMGRNTFPTEEEQFNAYKTVLTAMKSKPVVIRTLDIGGDKNLSYMKLPNEMNPFLGFRAIRLCLERKDIFETQLRALIRASVYGNLKIMFPMIATLQEFLDAKTFFYEVKEQLAVEGFDVSANIEVGVMVEIPAVAILADQFAKHVDFFSIGTNDLIQYTFAADRMSEKVAYLYQPYNPSLLRLIKMVIEAGKKEGKWTGMCGEMAGDLKAIPLLLGLGLDELSMSASCILPARESISKMTIKALRKLSTKAIMKAHNDEVVELVQQFIGEL